ncbi:hypothetical protein F4808DRAFT_21167 [Astrocystis sublimbata]|nr:hypothetical protein F4808DRAFT_21167 [Astrocystis sublimbata]
MEPNTKIWLVNLNEGHSMIETAFSGIWTETLLATASHTNGRDQHYALLQSSDEPDLLALVLGNCVIDPSVEAQKSGEQSISRLMEFVTHKELFHLNIDIDEFPLDPCNITMSFSQSRPTDTDSLPGKGEWAVSTSWLRDDADAGKPEKKSWIHIAPSEHATQLSQIGNIMNFEKILESTIACQTAE